MVFIKNSFIFIIKNANCIHVSCLKYWCKNRALVNVLFIYRAISIIMTYFGWFILWLILNLTSALKSLLLPQVLFFKKWTYVASIYNNITLVEDYTCLYLKRKCLTESGYRGNSLWVTRYSLYKVKTCQIPHAISNLINKRNMKIE